MTLAVAGFLQTRRSVNTEAAYRLDLRHLAAWCADGGAVDLLTISAADLARYRTACELAGASPATVARRLSAMTSFGSYAAEQGLEPALGTAPDLERPPLESASTADVISDADADALLRAADEIGTRSGALIRLLMLDGLKVGEVIRADAADLEGRAPRMTLAVARRGTRKLVLDRDTAVAVRRYLGTRRDGPLLLSERRGRPPERLTRFGIDYLIKQVARGAGVEPTVSGNTLRRRCVMAAHAQGTDLDAIRRNVGHSGRRTTRRYLASDTAMDADPRHPPLGASAP